MREIGTLADGNAARKLADYLLTQKIETRLEERPEGWIVWACDEDRVAEARRQFTDFTQNPQDARFAGAAKAAHELRLRELEADEEYQQRLSDFRKRMSEPARRPQVVTGILLAAAVLVAFLSRMDEHSEVYSSLQISSEGPQLTQIARGEVWRLVTPIFIHYGWQHLLFNCLAISYLAGQVERLQGSLRLIWLVFLIAVLSNLAQFYLGDPYDPRFGWVWWRSVKFGGLSGVGYGLFGYIWMKCRFEPEIGFLMPSMTVTLMMLWFVACLVGMVGSVANGAHAAGLAIGLLIGVGPHWWRTFRGS